MRQGAAGRCYEKPTVRTLDTDEPGDRGPRDPRDPRTAPGLPVLEPDPAPSTAGPRRR